MRLLLINPTESYLPDLYPGMEGDLVRLTALIKNLHGYLTNVDISLECEGTIDSKLYRMLFAENRRDGAPDTSIRRIPKVTPRMCTGSIFQVPNGRYKPKKDEALLSSLAHGKGEQLLVVGWDLQDTVIPSLTDLLAGPRGRYPNITVVSNCLGGLESSATVESFLGWCKGAGIAYMPTSEIVRSAWGEEGPR